MLRQTDIECVQTDLESSAGMVELAEAELVEVGLAEVELEDVETTCWCHGLIP
jgi:hypothetical protein